LIKILEAARSDLSRLTCRFAPERLVRQLAYFVGIVNEYAVFDTS
jgi:hypothetical protein